VEPLEIGEVFPVDPVDKLFGADTLFLSAYHNGRTVGVVSAEIKALVAAQLLEADPDIGLEVFDEMAYVYGAIRVWQG
jgi:hypothetical protein